MIPQSIRENKPKILRRIAFFFLILVFGILQNADALPTVFGLRFMPLLPLSVVIGMFERETYGLNFGILAGILWDINSGTGDGSNLLFLAVTGFVCGLLMTYLMMNNLLTACILGVFFELLYAVVSWLIFAVAQGFEGANGLLLSFYLPNALINIVTIPVFYYLARSIMKKFKLMENDELMA